MSVEVKVQVGCGRVCPQEWVNLDASYRVWLEKLPWLPRFYQRHYHGPITRHDVRRGLPFMDASVDYIYSSHMIEHLTWDQCRLFFSECYRVLKTEGRVRFLTPPLAQLAQNYLARYQSQDSTAADRFCQWLGVFPDDGKQSFWLQLIHRWQNKNRHQWLYDEWSLMAKLEDLGFNEVSAQVDWLSNFPDLAMLESSDIRNRSLCVEAVKLNM